MEFVHDDFLLHTRAARRLYHEYAASQPILDYHSHLPASEIARNRMFHNLCQLWLEGDHYKWRAMRANGVAERFCTGDAEPYEKYLAWARTVPNTLRNPLYHWTHLELKRYFDIGELLDEASAARIWKQAAALMESGEFAAQKILRRFRVEVVCTSDDPCDDLKEHEAIAASRPGFRVYPTFRPDAALAANVPERFNPWVDRLAAACNVEIRSLAFFLDALKRRHDFFHAHGGRISDHGLAHCYANPCTEAEAAVIFTKVRGGNTITPEEQDRFASFLMLYFGHLDAEKGWVKQLHLGALRNTRTRGMRETGADGGFDSVGDWKHASSLCAYLDLLDRDGSLPKTIVYNSNPADNYVFATAIGSFQDGSVPGKVQFGSGWWFLDQKEAIEWQLNALSNAGLLPRFVGMLTDSRSFMSFPRHEYFRRILCDMLGREMEDGALPNDEKLVGNLVRNLCFDNARQYLGLQLAPSSEKPRESVTARP
ncbi:MAG TPA: glucuronate isomerase [Candidatus Acidoferrales bacterium]|nr:glucuronate isomerase [Candidatus Acidoferrales bacterium]